MSDRTRPYNTRTRTILNLLKTPGYDTKGTSTWERNIALKKIKKSENKHFCLFSDDLYNECTVDNNNKTVKAWLEGIEGCTSTTMRQTPLGLEKQDNLITSGILQPVIINTSTVENTVENKKAPDNTGYSINSLQPVLYNAGCINEHFQINGSKELSIDDDDYSTKTISEFRESPSEYRPSSSYDSDTVSNISFENCATAGVFENLQLKKKTHGQSKILAHNTENAKKKPKKSESKKKLARNQLGNKAVFDKTSCANKSCVESADDSDLEHVIIVKNATKKKSCGIRVRDKRHCCYFCDKIMINIARHYELVHKNETQVAQILIMPKGSKRRRNAFEKLTKTADFFHNCEVLDKKEGELILVRRPSSTEKSTLRYSSYGPCPHCLGFMMKKRLWHHIKYNCKSSIPTSPEKQKRNIISESNALLVGLTNTQYSTSFCETILSKLKNDDISEVCRTDPTITKFGYLQFEKYGRSQCELIRQTMRQLGRFLLKVKMLNSDINSLSECLLPKHFDLVLAATKSLCGIIHSKINRPEFEIPSLALKLGHAIKKCLNIHRGMALRNGELKQNEMYLSFLNLMEMEWTIKISSCALSTMHKKKFNHKELLPLTEDLLALTRYLDREIVDLKEKLLHTNTDYRLWRSLASCILSRIILFNKKRSGEASKMTIEQYATRPTFQDQGTEELLISLSPLEKHLAGTMEVVDIEGKRGKRVPVIITPDIKTAIDVLIRARSMVGISKDNPYIFAPAESQLGHLRGHDCLRTACNEANLIHPEYITGTKLRKYIATVCQIFNLGKNEVDWLARHLGHDIRVHRNFYRLHENAVETTKISRLLIAIEKGEANKYSGKSLDEINIEDFPGLEEDFEESISNRLQNDSRVANNNDNSDGMSSSDDDIPLADYKNQQKSCKTVMPNNETEETEKEDTHKGKVPRLEGKQVLKENKIKKSNRKASTGKRKWTTEEIKSVLTFFKFDLKREILPGKEKCTECITKYPVLERRKWTDIKFYLKNYYTRNRRSVSKSDPFSYSLG